MRHFPAEWRRENPKGASATLYSLVNDYPGSPLVPQAKESIKRLEAGEPLESAAKKKRKK